MKGIAEWVQLRAKSLIDLLKLDRESVPHQTTYERVLAELDVAEFESVIGAFFAQQTDSDLTIALDGKVLRGTIPEGGTQGVHLLSAYAPQDGVVLMQVEVEGKTNEITTAPHLLQALDLRDCVVTGDAMFTQTALCEQIIRAGGDYLFPVKANQKHIQQAIADLFVPAPITAGHSHVALPETSAQTLALQCH